MSRSEAESMVLRWKDVTFKIPKHFNVPCEDYLDMFEKLASPAAVQSRVHIRSRVGLARVGLLTLALGLVAGFHLFLLLVSVSSGKLAMVRWRMATCLCDSVLPTP